MSDSHGRSPRDQGTGGRDFEDYPSEAGPVPVGEAPVGSSRAGLPIGVSRELTPVDKRERTKKMAKQALTGEGDHKKTSRQGPKAKPPARRSPKSVHR